MNALRATRAATTIITNALTSAKSRGDAINGEWLALISARRSFAVKGY
jgi:hypothetical protein